MVANFIERVALSGLVKLYKRTRRQKINALAVFHRSRFKPGRWLAIEIKVRVHLFRELVAVDCAVLFEPWKSAGNPLLETNRLVCLGGEVVDKSSQQGDIRFQFGHALRVWLVVEIITTGQDK